MWTDSNFKLGQKIVSEEEDLNGRNSKDFIWPACLPKNEAEYDPSNDGFVNGWLDSPPISQIDPFQLGIESSTFAGVRSVIYSLQIVEKINYSFKIQLYTENLSDVSSQVSGPKVAERCWSKHFLSLRHYLL